MSIHLSAFARKSLADITRRRAHSAVLFLAILIPVGGLVAVGVAQNSLSAAYSFTLSRRASPNDVTVVVDRSDGALVAAIAQTPNVSHVQAAMALDTQWRVASAPGHVDYRIVGYPDLRHATPRPFQLLTGHYPGAAEVVMEYGDLGLQRFRVGDSITVDVAGGTRRLRISGIARTRGSNPAVSGIGIGYMTSRALGRLPGFTFTPGPIQRQPFRSHALSLRLRRAADYQQTVHSLAPLLAARRATVLSVTPPQHSAPVAQLRGILSLVRVLLAVAVLLAVILIMSAVTALVAGQAGVIGTMKAIGATRARVVRGYATTVLVYCLAATPLGVVLGVVAGGRVASAMGASIPLAPGPLVVPPGVVALALVVGIVLPLVAAFLPLWLGTSITVHEALGDWGVSGVETTRRAGGTRLAERYATWIPQTAAISLRGLIRRPWRAAISVFTIAIAAACFLVIQTVAASVDRSIGGVWGSFHADVEVYVGGDASFRSVSASLAGIPNIRRIERVGWYGSQTPWGKIGVWGFEPTSRIHRSGITSGRALRAGDSSVCLVSDDLAARAGLHIGSTLIIPGPGGARSQQFTVVGTVDEPVDDLSQVGTIDMPVDDLYRLEGAPAAHVGDYANRVLVEAARRSPADVDRLTRAIDRVGRQAATAGKQGPIAEVFAFHDEVVRHQRSFLPVYLLLVAVALVVAAIGSLGLADVLAASLVDRRREIGLLRALGASGRSVAAIFWLEGIVLSLVAWTLAATAGIPLAYLFVERFRRLVMPTDFHFDPIDLVLMVAVTLAVATVASIAPAYGATRLRASDLLRAG